MAYYRAHRSDSYSITVDYGYDIHRISISATEWSRICSGRPVRLIGHGFYCEGKRSNDTWQVNKQGKGSISVVYGSEVVLYDCDLLDVEVTITDPTGKAVVPPDFT